MYVLIMHVKIREMLEESVSDLRNTMCELQQRLHSVDGEENEWKTRYETQVELNGQLERQISLIHERLEDLQGNPIGTSQILKQIKPKNYAKSLILFNLYNFYLYLKHSSSSFFFCLHCFYIFEM
uniref:Coiled-coil domain containing 169 n=1 Tax=Sphaeramia orbicularis TaxID=375764 RepID=A0A672YST6_9TELE